MYLVLKIYAPIEYTTLSKTMYISKKIETLKTKVLMYIKKRGYSYVHVARVTLWDFQAKDDILFCLAKNE
jgi:hypothetical protein